jgi:hypothetical protein
MSWCDVCESIQAMDTIESKPLSGELKEWCDKQNNYFENTVYTLKCQKCYTFYHDCVGYRTDNDFPSFGMLMEAGKSMEYSKKVEKESKKGKKRNK